MVFKTPRALEKPSAKPVSLTAMSMQVFSSRWLTITALALGLSVCALGVHATTRPDAGVNLPQSVRYGQRADVMAEADAIAQRQQLDPKWVRKVLAQARYLPVIAKLVLPPPPGTPKNWTAYRERFVEPRHIQTGIAFWQANAIALERAEHEFGVPAQIIVGLLGVETMYGRQTGRFRVVDALATLAFDFPKVHPRAQERSSFFKEELAQFLLFLQRTQANPAKLLGSYAGAMGLPQFMPSSWMKYAINFDGKGKVDIFNKPADAISSVANYFKSFGWQSGMPTRFTLEVEVDPANAHLAELLAPDIKPTFTAQQLRERGLTLSTQAADFPGLLAVVALQNGDPQEPGHTPSYVLGTENFYVITRYNWSSYYAMAVIELGEALAAARAAQ